jgi:hypothetical protein
MQPGDGKTAVAFREYERAQRAAEPVPRAIPKLRGITAHLDATRPRRGTRVVPADERRVIRDLLQDALVELAALRSFEDARGPEQQVAWDAFLELYTPEARDKRSRRGAALDALSRVLVRTLAMTSDAFAALDPGDALACTERIADRITRLEGEVLTFERALGGRSVGRDNRGTSAQRDSVQNQEKRAALTQARSDLEHDRREYRKRTRDAERLMRLEGLLVDASRLGDPMLSGEAALQLLEEDGRFIVYPTVSLAVATWQFQIRQARPHLPSDDPRSPGIESAGSVAEDALLRVAASLTRTAANQGRPTRDPNVFAAEVVRVSWKMASARALWVAATTLARRLPSKEELARLCGLRAANIVLLSPARGRLPYVGVMTSELAATYGVNAKTVQGWLGTAAQEEGFKSPKPWILALVAKANADGQQVE